jgi:hypothetical protein
VSKVIRSELKRDIEAKFGRRGFLNIGEIAEFLGTSREYPRSLMEGYKAIKISRAVKFSVDDIADAIVEKGVMQ